MVYREPDKDRTHELAVLDENRAALERLAAAGMERKQRITAENQARLDAQLARKTVTRFRIRALQSQRRLRFAGAWLVGCTALSCVAAIVALLRHGDLAEAVAVLLMTFIAANATAALIFPVMIAYWLYSLGWRRRDARALLAWDASLPFPVKGLVETLSLDRSLAELRVAVAFDTEVPERAVVEGLVGNVKGGEKIKVEVRPRGIALYASNFQDEDTPNDLVVYLREVVTKVLLPLHAVHAVAVVDVRDADHSETWESEQRGGLDKLLGRSGAAE